MQTQQRPPTQPPSPKKQGRTGLLIAAAAFAIVLIVSAVVLLSDGGASDVPTATAPPATTDPTVTPAEAIAVANAYLVAFNAGDVDVEMALFAPDARVSNNFLGEGTLEEEQLRNTWNAAQGTKLTTEGCAAVDAPAPPQRVTCTGATYSALVQAVGAPPVPTQVSMAIGPNGIASLSYVYGQPDFNHVSTPFELWMQANHAEIDVPYDWGESIEEAEASGLLVAQYAAEWAAYLETNNCTYLDGC